MKRVIRKAVSFLFLFLLLCPVITGCGKKNEKNASGMNEKEEKKEEEMMVEVPPMSTEGLLYGIILKKEEKKLFVQSDRGRMLTLPISEKTDIQDVGEELEAGIPIKAEYTGKEKAIKSVERITESDKKPELSNEALALAGEVIWAFYHEDRSMLASHCEYPINVEFSKKRKISGEKEFSSLSLDELFEKELTAQIIKTNLFLLKEYPKGVLLGTAKKNLILSNTKAGWKIKAFRSQ